MRLDKAYFKLTHSNVKITCHLAIIYIFYLLFYLTCVSNSTNCVVFWVSSIEFSFFVSVWKLGVDHCMFSACNITICLHSRSFLSVWVTPHSPSHNFITSGTAAQFSREMWSLLWILCLTFMMQECRTGAEKTSYVSFSSFLEISGWTPALIGAFERGFLIHLFKISACLIVIIIKNLLD